MDTLVKRLRKEQQWGNSLDGEAADRIEELEALVEKYRDATVQIARWITTGEIPK